MSELECSINQEHYVRADDVIFGSCKTCPVVRVLLAER
jgi:hypothetical protein